jgi:hypothetical protein
MSLKSIYLIISFFIFAHLGYSQHPTWPKFIENNKLKSRYVGKKVKLNLIGKEYHAKQFLYFKFLVDQTIEGWDYNSMHLLVENYHDSLMIKIFDCKLRELLKDSIKIEIQVQIYNKQTEILIKNLCFKELIWFDRKRLKGIYRPDFSLFGP